MTHEEFYQRTLLQLMGANANYSITESIDKMIEDATNVTEKAFGTLMMTKNDQENFCNMLDECYQHLNRAIEEHDTSNDFRLLKSELQYTHQALKNVLYKVFQMLSLEELDETRKYDPDYEPWNK